MFFQSLFDHSRQSLLEFLNIFKVFPCKSPYIFWGVDDDAIKSLVTMTIIAMVNDRA